MRVFAEDPYEKIINLAEEDCGKIAAQLGEEVPRVNVGGVKIDTYSGNCGFSREGTPGYDSLQVEDMQITINMIDFSRYSAPESARNSIGKSIKYYEAKQKANAAGNDFESTVWETSDGYEYLLKGYLLAVWPELRKTHTAVVGIARESCVIAVTGRSFYEDMDTSYHVGSQGKINKHPEFNHDREAEMLILARKNAEEIFSVLDCGSDIPSPSSTTPAVVTKAATVDNQVSQNPYGTCAWNCAEQTEAKYQCSFEGPLDSCVTDKISYQSACQNTCWDSWKLPPKTKINEGGGQLRKVEQNGKTALLVAGYDRSVSDSAMEKIKDDLAGWDPDGSQLTAPVKTPDIPLGLGVLSLDGDVDIKRPGSNAWETLRKGTSIPEGSQIFTGIDGNVWIYGEFGVANISHGSYITINKNSSSQGKDPNIRFDIKAGEVEIRYEKANYQGVIQTRTPSATATVKGTKFFTSYNQEQRYSAIGVYEGQVEVQSLTTGEKANLSSDSDSESNLIFIPLQKPQEENKQPAVVAKQENQEPKSSMGPIVPAAIILALIVTLLILYRKGKLLPLYKTSIQKLSELVKKIKFFNS